MPPATWIDELQLSEVRAALATADGRGVRIAVLDSGIETTHPDLGGLQLADDTAFEIDGHFLRAAANTDGDVMGHGTAIASIIRSLAPAAEIGSFRVLDGGLKSRSSIVWEAARHAIERGYHILNCSFGSPGDVRFVMPYKEWIDLAYLRNVHVVASCNNHDASVREWPGWFPTVVTVNFASLPPNEWLRRKGSLVEFSAHGHDVRVPWKGGGYRVVSGSSYAAPRLTAWLARLISVYPDLRVEEAKALLRRLAAE